MSAKKPYRQEAHYAHQVAGVRPNETRPADKRTTVIRGGDATPTDQPPLSDQDISELQQAAQYARFYGQPFHLSPEQLQSLLSERDALLAFKNYVHQRLDAAGVPVDPDSPHKAEGCRVGGRLDWVFARLGRIAELEKSLPKTADGATCDRCGLKVHAPTTTCPEGRFVTDAE